MKKQAVVQLRVPIAAAIGRLQHGGDAQLSSVSPPGQVKGSASHQHERTPASKHPHGPRFPPCPLLSHWLPSPTAQP